MHCACVHVCMYVCIYQYSSTRRIIDVRTRVRCALKYCYTRFCITYYVHRMYSSPYLVHTEWCSVVLCDCMYMYHLKCCQILSVCNTQLVCVRLEMANSRPLCRGIIHVCPPLMLHV